ncbi:MAG: hypothetical protein GY794_03970, partial [bacterium]|nr:hypothetical protein [bacterium]
MTLGLDQLLVDGVLTELSADQRVDLRSQLQRLLTDREELLGKLVGAYGNYAKQLTTLNLDAQRLAEVVQKLRTVLDERLLWTATTSSIGPEWVDNGKRAMAWTFASENWSRAGSDLTGLWRSVPLLTAGALLAFAALLGLRRPLRRRAMTIAEAVGNPYQDRFRLTLEVLLITGIWAIPWPLLLGFNAWLLRGSIDVTNFSAAVGHGLTNLTISVFFLEFYRQVSRAKGLAEIHFQWSDRARGVLNQNLGWIRFFIYPTSFLLGLAELQPADLIDDAPGRAIFLVELLVVTLFYWRLLHPRR